MSDAESKDKRQSKQSQNENKEKAGKVVIRKLVEVLNRIWRVAINEAEPK